MRLVTVEVNAEDIENGQQAGEISRMASDPVYLAAKRIMEDVDMVGRDSIQCGPFGLELPPEAVAWIQQADRHFQGLDDRMPVPITFNVIHPL